MNMENLIKIKELIDEIIGENEPTDEELNYDDDKTILEKIKESKCHSCKYSWERLKENHIFAYNMIY